MQTVPAQVNTGNDDMCMQNNKEANVSVLQLCTALCVVDLDLDNVLCIWLPVQCDSHYHCIVH